MIAKELIKKIKDDRNGYIMLEVVNSDDDIGFNVQVIKSDLISRLERKFKSDEETGYYLDNCGFFSKHYAHFDEEAY